MVSSALIGLRPLHDAELREVTTSRTRTTATTRSLRADDEVASVYVLQEKIPNVPGLGGPEHDDRFQSRRVMIAQLDESCATRLAAPSTMPTRIAAGAVMTCRGVSIGEVGLQGATGVTLDS